MTEAEPATFFLTDYLARNFERLVIGGLGIDRHPELLPMYFGNYRRIVYLAQSDDPVALAQARAAADRLGLEFELRRTGLAPFASAMASTDRPARAGHAGGHAADDPGAEHDRLRRRGCCLMASLSVIWWRDIPAQVMAKEGRLSNKYILPGRFQEAIDRAAVKAGLAGTDDYLAQWRRESRACGDDLEAEVAAEVELLEAAYPAARLKDLAAAGGLADAS